MQSPFQGAQTKGFGALLSNIPQDGVDHLAAFVAGLTKGCILWCDLLLGQVNVTLLRIHTQHLYSLQLAHSNVLGKGGVMVATHRNTDT